MWRSISQWCQHQLESNSWSISSIRIQRKSDLLITKPFLRWLLLKLTLKAPTNTEKRLPRPLMSTKSQRRYLKWLKPSPNWPQFTHNQSLSRSSSSPQRAQPSNKSRSSQLRSSKKSLILFWWMLMPKPPILLMSLSQKSKEVMMINKAMLSLKAERLEWEWPMMTTNKYKMPSASLLKSLVSSPTLKSYQSPQPALPLQILTSQPSLMLTKTKPTSLSSKIQGNQFRSSTCKLLPRAKQSKTQTSPHKQPPHPSLDK